LVTAAPESHGRRQFAHSLKVMVPLGAIEPAFLHATTFEAAA
jgi:hypothetical protein